MDLVKIMETFPTQEHCIEYLERLRWHGSPECPQCESTHVRRRNEHDTGRIGRWNCHECKSTFKVTHGNPVFHGTKIPLQKWFLAIALMETNAKKSLSSCQLSRDLGLKQKACWRLMMVIRVSEMGKDNVLLQGIVEADETYIGGKRKKNYDKEEGEPRKRGRGTAKDVVLGAVARGGKVVAELVENAKGSTIAEFITEFVKTDDSQLYTDQYKGDHNEIGKQMKHETINRSQKWEPGGIHTNTMEGFWSFVKRAWYGSHHHYSTQYTPLYLAEACYKYNYRDENIFAKVITGCFQ